MGVYQVNCRGAGAGSPAPIGRWGPAGAVSLTRLHSRRSARAAESARLEIVCWATNRGFKSHLLRSGEGSIRQRSLPIVQGWTPREAGRPPRRPRATTRPRPSAAPGAPAGDDRRLRRIGPRGRRLRLRVGRVRVGRGGRGRGGGRPTSKPTIPNRTTPSSNGTASGSTRTSRRREERATPGPVPGSNPRSDGWRRRSGCPLRHRNQHRLRRPRRQSPASHHASAAPASRSRAPAHARQRNRVVAVPHRARRRPAASSWR